MFSVHVGLCRRSHMWRVLVALIIAAGGNTVVRADVNIPAGAQVHLAGGSAQLACTDLLIQGAAVQGAGANTTGVRNLTLAAGGSLDMAGSSIQLAQQYTNNGTVNGVGGSLTRVDSASCPAIGKLGAISISEAPPAETVAAVPTLGSVSFGLLMLGVGLIGGLRAARQGSSRERRPLR